MASFSSRQSFNSGVRPPTRKLRNGRFSAALIICLVFLVSICRADDDLMRELMEEQRRLEEERLHESGHQYDDEYLEKQQDEMKRQQQTRQDEAKAAQDRLQEQQNERIREQREAEFEANLARMNEDQKKAALKQKKKDAKVVKKIIKAAQKGDYYSVLGLRNFELKVGPFRIYKYQLGPFTFFRPSSKDVKKAYRGRAMMTHPDKNRDGRAQEAFVAVEESASILMDDKVREEYDMQRKVRRVEQRAVVVGMFNMVTTTIRQQISRVVWIFKNLLGPFATPIFIISCLII